MSHNHDSITLLEEKAKPGIVESLYEYGLLSQQGREAGLSLLNPHLRWGYWVSTILLILGWVFILAGIVYFFAFNWEKMSTYYKFSTIQVSILVCLAGAWAYAIDNLRGQLFLTGGCILIGIFLAVFGQTYQTGADSYQLFLAWAFIITPLVVISQFTPLWAIWLLLVNITLILFWEQGLAIQIADQYYLYILLLFVNGLALCAREWLYNRKVDCLQGRWHRILLTFIILVISFIPISIYIMDNKFVGGSILYSALLGFLIQIAFLYYYRYHFRDPWVFAMTLISFSLIFCEIAFEILNKLIPNATLNHLFMTLAILGIFSASAYILRRRVSR